MACKPILSYSDNCNKSTVAGVQSLYLVGHNFLIPLSGSTEVYAVGVNEMVNAIGLSGGTKFSKIGILPKAVALKNPYSYDPSKLTTGTWLAMGLDGMLYVTAVEGAVDGAANAYTITFSGTSADFTPIVDPTIVVSLTV